MNKPIDKAQAILEAKGSNLMQTDLDEMREIFMQVALDDWDDTLFLMEGVALIVNDPSYTGDIAPIV
jgi:hypothetical protein